MELKEKTPHTILNEIIEAAKECGQVMLQADRANFGIKDKAGKANFVTKYDCKIQEMLEKKLSEILLPLQLFHLISYVEFSPLVPYYLSPLNRKWFPFYQYFYNFSYFSIRH